VSVGRAHRGWQVKSWLQRRAAEPWLASSREL